MGKDENAMQVKPSFYNEILDKKDGIALYNTRTGKMMRSFGEQAISRSL